MNALVLDAHLKSSLAAIRSLGSRQIPVIAGSHRQAAMGFYSRYAARAFVYPSPLQDRQGFVKAVTQQAERAGETVLFAFGDATLLPLVEDEYFLRRHGNFLLPASHCDFQTAFDKGHTLELAQKLGLEVPHTCFCASGSDFSALLANLSYPVVLKPRRSVTWNGNSGAHNPVVFGLSKEDLEKKCAAILTCTGEFPLVQVYIPGEQLGVEFLCDKGAVLAACAHRRIRSVPPAGGAGVVTETVPLSYQDLGLRAERLVAALQWSGPIMIEFKTNPADGIPRLMEINGRFWGSLPLAIAAGVDFPYLYYEVATGQPLVPRVNYQEGVVSRHFLGDLRHLIWVLFQRDPMRRAAAFPGRLQTIMDFLFAPKSWHSDVLAWRDLKPAAMEMIDVLVRRLQIKLRSADYVGL